ncbi:hypothetical protein [Aeromonas jandaei]|uniref:hypothetical protein n=1 Tax=Aeromonas jandaei TaxID=650 RepID=UPI00059C59B7|nr:hypothetical protein [Aeromonas jandaei]
MTTELNPSEATSLALNTITNQIRLLADMPAEHCKQAVAGLEPIVTANLTMISEAANAHIDEFNGLIDQLEALDGELNDQIALVSQLRQQVAEAEQRIAAARQEGAAELEAKADELYKAQRALNEVETKFSALQFTSRQTDRQLADLKAMDPKGMKDRIKEKNKELEGLRTAIAKHKSNEAAYRSEVLKLERRIKDLLDAINEQDRELESRHGVIMELESCRDAKLVWFKHLAKTYKGEDGTLWNVYLVDHGLQSNLPYLINDLNWKLHAMRSDATGCTVMLSEWMSPIFPSVIARDIPMEAIRDIHAFMLDALAITHPHLQPRAEWAQTVHISEIGLNAKVQGLLEDAGITDLWKLMVNQSDKLMAIKGIGAKLADQIISAGQAAVRQWEKEQAEASQQPEQHKEAV